MPKRPNPFGDSAPLQFKSHITNKEVDLGVEKDKKMQLVYEKTRNMLFKGAKISTALPHPESVDENPGFTELATDPGQLRIDATGHLYSDSTAVTSSSDSAEKLSKMEVDANANSCYGNNNTILSLPRGQMQIDKMGQLHRVPSMMSPTR